MTKKEALQLFEQRIVRTVWDDEEEKWYFSVVDVVEALTESANPTDYIKKMKKRDPLLSKGWGQIVTPLSMQTQGGKQRVNLQVSMVAGNWGTISNTSSRRGQKKRLNEKIKN